MYQPQYQPQSKQELRAWLKQYVRKMHFKQRPSRISKGMTIKGSKKYGKYKGKVHACMCHGCAKRVKERSGKCPICRAKIEKINTIYYTGLPNE